MAGGSPERESPRDCRCVHCKLFFSNHGIGSHEPNCRWSEWDIPHPDAVLDEDDDEGGTPADKGSEETPVEGVDPSVEPPAEGGTPESPALATDGGNPAFGGPEPVPVTDGGEVDEDADEDVDDVCPDCGEDVYVDADEVLANNDDVAAKYRTMLEENDRVCLGCRGVY